MKNNSKYYYLSNENMSDIKESIEEYSMNFQRDSQRPSKYHQSISEDIQVSRTNKLSASKQQKQAPPEPKYSRTSDNAIVTSQHPQQSQKQIQVQQTSQINQHIPTNQSFQSSQPQQSAPLFLGQQLFQTIREKYFQTNRVATIDPYVLFDFYNSQRKGAKIRGEAALRQQQGKLDKMMPSQRRKAQVRLDFQRILAYSSQDVYYTLVTAAQMRLRDRDLKDKANLLNQELKKTQKPKAKPVQQVVNRLYGQAKGAKKDLQGEEAQRLKRRQFGRRLSEAFQNATRQVPGGGNQSPASLFQFWEELYDRQEYGLEWIEERAEADIRRYMIEQVQDLKANYQRKIGYNEGNGVKLRQFLQKYPNLPEVYIPIRCFGDYAQVYNLDKRQQQQSRQRAQKADEDKYKNAKVQEEVKKFGRPVSATPLTILAQPKTQSEFITLSQKYGDDKIVKKQLQAQRIKIARQPFQYGVYDIVEELKIKGRVKPECHGKKNENYDTTVNKMLARTLTNPTSFTNLKIDRVSAILQEQGLSRQKQWKQLGPILQEALLVKAYQEKWLRQAMIKFGQKALGKSLNLESDKVVVGELIGHFSRFDEDNRESQLSRFQAILDTSSKIAERAQQINHLQDKGQKFMRKEMRLMQAELQEKVIEYVNLRNKIRQGFTQEKLNVRDYLKKTFSQLWKDHKEAVRKYFNVVEVKGDSECPKLLKYQFFRLTKEINPFLLTRDERPKNHAWVPTRNSPDSFNYRTFNQYAEVYTKDRNRIVAEPEDPKRSKSLWGQKKSRDREKIIMTYEDAKECTFNPKISKKQA